MDVVAGMVEKVDRSIRKIAIVLLLVALLLGIAGARAKLNLDKRLDSPRRCPKKSIITP